MKAPQGYRYRVNVPTECWAEERDFGGTQSGYVGNPPHKPESVSLGMSFGVHGYAASLTPSDARWLAERLMRCADAADAVTTNRDDKPENGTKESR
jgi:hypothetical protein